MVAQILAGLVYLNTKPRSIIHYDLKPANILFDRNGECKITVSASGGRRQVVVGSKGRQQAAAAGDGDSNNSNLALRCTQLC